MVECRCPHYNFTTTDSSKCHFFPAQKVQSHKDPYFLFSQPQTQTTQPPLYKDFYGPIFLLPILVIYGLGHTQGGWALFLPSQGQNTSEIPCGQGRHQNLYKGWEMNLNLQADKLVKVIMPIWELMGTAGRWHVGWGQYGDKAASTMRSIKSNFDSDQAKNFPMTVGTETGFSPFCKY